jgi:hypothetical protein
MTEWTIVHSFYAGMGGFVIDLSSNFGDKTYIHGNALQMTLTAQGVLFLVSAGYDLPSISRETILDHSKADGLAKALVCLQAGYMLIQCAARVRSHLALSFLEINTLGHVVCALTMYLFWLKKPQDVRTTSRMSDEDIQPLCAYMYMESSLSRAYDGNKREFSRLRHLDRSLPQSPRKEPMEPVHSEISAVLQAPLPPESSICTLHGGDLLVETGIGPRTGLTRRTRRGRADVIVYQRPAVHLGTIDVLRWKLAWQFIENRKLLKQYQLRELLHRFVASELGVDLVVAEVPNWPHDAGLLPRSLHSTWVAISLAVGLYGGLHAAAWNAHFPTTAERVMWCTSSILVTASGPLAMMYIYLKWFFGEHGKNAGICLALFTGALMIFGGMIFLAVVGGLLAYIPARIFLVVEAFISLRDMPVEVYQTPNWTQLIPHL